MKYDIYVKILDEIVSEAPEKYKRYYFDRLDVERLNQARARASIHLFLKVYFGMVNFEDRESIITDGPYDGGIDAYHISVESKCIYVIQAKFRTNEDNYENKKISLEEILCMDVDRILQGEQVDENNNEYNGKIKKFQGKLRDIPDIPRYRYEVFILANLPKISLSKIRMLTGGFPAQIFDHERCYKELVFPVVTGTYFTANDINIPLDLSNKNAGSKISYNVLTKNSECIITVLFVPTLELAKIMDKYKNSILKYNPRSYLEFDGKIVNNSIRETMQNTETNEFALFNNGITMISDDTFISENVGQKNRAQLLVKNPQIINGGQTTYTLSRIYAENNLEDAESIFSGKEVLLKIITLSDQNDEEGKIQLIEEISSATNKQTPVINADKFSNDIFHKEVQKAIFDSFGLFYERKRGEFSDGVISGYIDKKQVIERNHFFKLYYSANGRLDIGLRKKLFQNNDFPNFDISCEKKLNNFYFAYRMFYYYVDEIKKSERANKSIQKLGADVKPFREIYAKIYVYTKMKSNFNPFLSSIGFENEMGNFNRFWVSYNKFHNSIGKQQRRIYIDPITREEKVKRTRKKAFNHTAIDQSLKDFLQSETYKKLYNSDAVQENSNMFES